MVKVVLMAPDDLPIPPTSGGSVQIYVENLIRYLNRQQDVEVQLISPGRTAMQSVQHVAIPLRKTRYQRKALRVLKRINPDVVQIENRPSWVSPVRRTLPNAKIVLNLHSTTFLQKQHIDPARAKRALRRADAVTLNSHSLQRIITKQFGVGSKDWHPIVVYPGVRLERFHPTAAKQEIDQFTSSRPLQVLYVGRVIRQKGVHILIAAIRRLHRQNIPVQLTIIGRTPPWEQAYAIRLRRLAKGLPIRFVGFTSPSKLPKYYWNADVFVCPSQGHEAFGLVNVEAMAAGLPVIASKQGGIREIVDSSCGILVGRYRSSAAFADALEKMATQPERLITLRRGALERAAQFRWSKSAEGFSQIYQQLINKL